jgi:hypothetical protein
VIVYTMFVNITDPNSPTGIMWYTSILPTILFIPLTIISTFYGVISFINEEVES